MDDAGELLLLEHLGMIHVPAYLAEWEKKQCFYKEEGLVEGESLFTTTEGPNGAIDSTAIERVVNLIATRMGL